MIHREPAGRFDAAGPAGANGILFVHGARMTRKMWLPQMQALADRYRVAALDLPGHGALAEMRFGLEVAVQVAADVIEQEASGRALLVGSSLGGYVGLELASRHPNRVAGLVLSGCTLNIRGLIELPFRMGARLLAGVDERWLTWAHRAVCRRMFPASLAEPIIEAGFYFDAVPDALQELMGKNFLRNIQAFPGPILFLNGQRDIIFRWNEAAFVAAASNARLQVIRWGSHRCSLEHPAAFTEAVRCFAQAIGW